MEVRIQSRAVACGTEHRSALAITFLRNDGHHGYITTDLLEVSNRSVGDVVRRTLAHIDRFAEAPRPTASSKTQDKQQFFFDAPIRPEDLPFDPNENPTNRYFADLAAEFIRAKKDIAALRARVQALERRTK